MVKYGYNFDKGPPFAVKCVLKYSLLTIKDDGLKK